MSQDRDPADLPGWPIPTERLRIPLPAGISLREDDHLCYVLRDDRVLGVMSAALSAHEITQAIVELASADMRRNSA